MLNYGYAILASRISVEIVSHGYLTQLGIHHHSDTNPFNLTYDLIEPFRPVADRYVFSNREADFDFRRKTQMASDLLETEIRVGHLKYRMVEALAAFIQMALRYLTNGESLDLEVGI